MKKISLFLLILLLACNSNKNEITKREFYPNDTLKRKYSLNSKGLISGSDSIYGIDGSIKKVTLWEDGKLVDSILKYGLFGKITSVGNIKGNKLIFYRNNGSKQSAVYLKDGLKSGLQVLYNTDEKIKGFKGYKKNKENGLYIGLKKNNIPKHFLQLNNHYEAEFLGAFYDSGKLRSLTVYDSLSNGYMLRFYLHGSLREISEIKRGKTDGLTYLFSEDAELIKKERK